MRPPAAGCGSARVLRHFAPLLDRVEFHGSTISSDGGLLLYRELDDVLGLHERMGEQLVDTRTGHNRLHSIVALSRQSISCNSCDL